MQNTTQDDPNAKAMDRLLQLATFSKTPQKINQSLKQTVRSLEKANTDIIRRLIKVCMYKDNETGNHILRVGKICRFLAEKAGVPAEDARLIGIAAPMHDIGKLGLPDAILYKPGKLTSSEFEILKTHTTLGGKLFNRPDCGEMEMARQIALYHHEWWNGHGYPYGLSKTEIPLSARITAVADVFDVLLSWRPYNKKGPVTGKEAAEIIQESRGTQFDPLVVDVFTEHMAAVIKARAQVPHHDDTDEAGAASGTDDGTRASCIS